MANVPPPTGFPPPAGPDASLPPGAAGPYAPESIPTSVKAIRVMLWILVGVAALMLAAGLFLAQDARQAGAASAGPLLVGAPALVFALVATKRSRGVWIGLIVFESFTMLMLLGQLSSQGGRGILGLALHIAILVLVLRRPARRYYRRGADHPADGVGANPYQQYGPQQQPPQAF